MLMDTEILEDADLLDIVRRLRSYMTTLDNIHHVLTQLQLIDDQAIKDQVWSLIDNTPEVSLKVSSLLRSIENNAQYRAMVKKYNINLNDEEHNG